MTDFERAKRFRTARTELNRHGKQTLMQVHEATGMSPSTLSNLENPELGRIPSSKNVKMLADYYGVSVAWLTGQTDSPSLDPDIQMITGFTGLSAESVRIIRNITRDEVGQRLVNRFIQSDEFGQLVYTAQKLCGQDDYQETDNEEKVDYKQIVDQNRIITAEVSFSEGDMEDYQMWKMQKLTERMIQKALEKK